MCSKFKCNVETCSKINVYEEAIEHYKLCNGLPIKCVLGCDTIVEQKFMEIHLLEKCVKAKFKCSFCE